MLRGEVVAGHQDALRLPDPIPGLDRPMEILPAAHGPNGDADVLCGEIGQLREGVQRLRGAQALAARGWRMVARPACSSTGNTRPMTRRAVLSETAKK